MTELLIDPRKEHVGEYAWRWVVQVGSLRLRHASTARVSYDEEGAGVLSLEVEADLTGLARAPVRVLCGYGTTDGELTEWFSGDLGAPFYDDETGISEAEAYGVLGAMGRQYFDEVTELRGVTLRNFFGIVRRLLYDARARIDVRSGDLSIEDTVFPGEDSLREGAQAVIEGFDHVMRDRPGFGLIVAPRPRPAALSKYTAVFSAADYPVDQPKIKPSGDGPYAKVAVFRRDENGVEVVRADAEVKNPSGSAGREPKPNEIFWVADFDGDQAQAQNTADETARALTIQGFSGTLSGIAPHEELLQDAPVLLRRVERDRNGRFRRDYASVITEIELDLVQSEMSFGFDALRVRDEEMPERSVPGAASPYVRDSRPLTAFGEDEEGVYYRLGSSEPYAGEDAEGLWIDPTVSEEAGEDDGLWVEISEDRQGSPSATRSGKWADLETVTWGDLEDVTWRELEQ